MPAEVMPGGAPLRATSSTRTKKKSGSASSKPSASRSRTCKYGPRGDDGLCPKKPKAPKKPKKPCKYGPRVNGLCPKKPSPYSSGPSSSSDDSSPSLLDKRVPIKTKTGKQSSTTIRAEVNKVTNKVAEQVGNKVADATWEWLKKPENQKTLKTTAVAGLLKIKNFAGPIGAIIGGALIGLKLGQYSNQLREQGAQNFASLQIANVTRLAKRALTIQEMTKLREFHAAAFRAAYDAKRREERMK